MAARPAWTIRNNMVISENFSFAWNSGFAEAQKKKNVANLHTAILEDTGETPLEVSTKSNERIGVSLSAFSLTLNGTHLENIFQASKVYEYGGPYTDLLHVHPRDAKRDDRHRNFGQLISFELDGESWPINPLTAFYDYIYILAVVENFGYTLDLWDYDWFTDIEFNPNRSINCQARALALYKLIQNENSFRVLSCKNEWLLFHGEHVIY